MESLKGCRGIFDFFYLPTILFIGSLSFCILLPQITFLPSVAEDPTDALLTSSRDIGEEDSLLMSPTFFRWSLTDPPEAVCFVLFGTFSLT